VTLLLSGDRAMPMTWGLGRAVILLPRQATTWDDDRQHMVLLHELAHVRRGDALTQLLAYLIRAVYWFQPLVWWAAARLRLEQERACDDLVLAAGCRASDYAENLLALSTTQRANVLAAPVALAVSRKVRLRRRIVRLLDPCANRAPAGRRLWCGTAVMGLCVCLALAPFGLRATAYMVEPAPQVPTGESPPPIEKKVAEVYDTLTQKYIKKLDEKKLTTDAIKGLLAGLGDPYADYYDADTLAQMQKEFQGQMVGIGIQITKDKDQIKVVTPLENSPALKAGLRPGDLILAIDGKKTEGVPLADCVKLILGPVGTPVKLTVQQDQAKKEFTITRATVKLPSIHGFMRDADGKWDFLLDPAGKIGYVQILQFNAQTTAELTQAVQQLQKQGLKGLILDLRFCPGGLLNQAAKVADLFLAEGTILSVKDKDGKEQVFKAKKGDELGDFPLVVLVNQFTASSAEILAGALQDNKRAVILGSRTYGKGSVQSILTLKDGSALKLTTANYYLPSGRHIQKKPGAKTWGIDPNEGFYLPLTKEQTGTLDEKLRARGVLGSKEPPKKIKPMTPEVLEKEFADPQLAAALKTMTAKLTTGTFAPVGKTKDALLQHLKQLEHLQKQQQAMQQQLEQIREQLVELESILGKEKE
jgi:carboxyl-terminal processing protease